METASFTGILKVIFYFILFYYIFKFVMRLLLPVLMKKAVQKAEENLRQHEYNYRQPQEKTSDKSQAHKPNDKQLGEYVDYEEIE